MMKRMRIAPFVSDILKGSLFAVLMTVAANCDTGTKPQPIDSKKPSGTPTGGKPLGGNSSSSSGGLGSSVSSGGGSIASNSSSSGGIGNGIGGNGIGGPGGNGIGNGGIGGNGIGGGIGGNGIGGGIGGNGIGGGNNGGNGIGNGGNGIGNGGNGIAIPNRTPVRPPPTQPPPVATPNVNGTVQPGETARVTVSFDANGQVAYNISVQQGQVVGAVSYSLGGITPSPGIASSTTSGPRAYSVPYTAEFGMNFTVGVKTCTVVKRVLPVTPVVFSSTLNGGLTCTP